MPWRELARKRVFLNGTCGFFGCDLIQADTRALGREVLQGIISVLTRYPALFRFKAMHLTVDAAVVEIAEAWRTAT